MDEIPVLSRGTLVHSFLQASPLILLILLIGDINTFHETVRKEMLQGPTNDRPILV